MDSTLNRAPVLKLKNLSVAYGSIIAVKQVNLDIAERSVCALIGPSGCGKSSLLRSVNRMNDFIPSCRVSGQIEYRGEDIYQPGLDPVTVRRTIGMVFQKPNPFPSSIKKNIIWGPRINGFRGDCDELIQHSLEQAALWDEVKDRLSASGLSLSGGQQQRLCIARAIAMNPDVILMDEPCASLDPNATSKIEELILQLRKKFSIVIVTHSMAQAKRISDQTAFMYQGELIEAGATEAVFNRPRHELTQSYVQGHFG